jgi:hypothetical protein
VTDDERKLIQTAIISIADPHGNWRMGWEMLCELAGVDPNQHRPPFKPHPLDERKTYPH